MRNKKLDEFLNLYGNFVFGRWNAPKDSIYIGRGSIYGNPYPMKDKSDEERIRVISLYTKYLRNKVNEDKYFREKVKELHDKNLACYCNNGTNDLSLGARYCHGLILKAMADYLNK